MEGAEIVGLLFGLIVGELGPESGDDDEGLVVDIDGADPEGATPGLFVAVCEVGGDD